MVDLDMSVYVEYDDRTMEPLALIETAVDVGQQWKAATVTVKLARRAALPAFVVLYKKSLRRNPADQDFTDIDLFRVRQLTPECDLRWRIYQPSEWALFLLSLRDRCAQSLDADLFPGVPTWEHSRRG
jgi:hypothetical protein